MPATNPPPVLIKTAIRSVDVEFNAVMMVTLYVFFLHEQHSPELIQ